MANFTFASIYPLGNNGGSDYFVGSPLNLSATATDGDGASTVFSIGEPIDDGLGDGNYIMAGHYQNGVIIFNGSLYQLLTNDSYTGGDTFTAEASDYTVCFLTGTMIATPDGERAVESLAIGDLVLTVDGETRPVRWMGVQTISRVFSDPQRGRPVTIRAGALGDNVPHRDLHVSPDHALFVDGILAHAGALVNGTSIVRMADVPERFTYHHIELEDHALVFAEGAPAETFVDAVTRRRFDNFAEYEALYGDEQPDMIVEHDAPRALTARQVPPTLRDRLAARAEALGFVEAIAA